MLPAGSHGAAPIRVGPEVAADAARSGRDLVVMKFGGTSVGDTSKIKDVARRAHSCEPGMKLTDHLTVAIRAQASVPIVLQRKSLVDGL